MDESKLHGTDLTLVSVFFFFELLITFTSCDTKNVKGRKNLDPSQIQQREQFVDGMWKLLQDALGQNDKTKHVSR